MSLSAPAVRFCVFCKAWAAGRVAACRHTLSLGWVEGSRLMMVDQDDCPLGGHPDWRSQVIRLRTGETVTIGPWAAGMWFGFCQVWSTMEVDHSIHLQFAVLEII
jgi:hypothetical protein